MSPSHLRNGSASQKCVVFPSGTISHLVGALENTMRKCHRSVALSTLQQFMLSIPAHVPYPSQSMQNSACFVTPSVSLLIHSSIYTSWTRAPTLQRLATDTRLDQVRCGTYQYSRMRNRGREGHRESPERCGTRDRTGCENAGPHRTMSLSPMRVENQEPIRIASDIGKYEMRGCSAHLL